VSLGYAIAEVGNYLENKIDLIAIIINDDDIDGQMLWLFFENL
jgi:hypothetical protein